MRCAYVLFLTTLAAGCLSTPGSSSGNTASGELVSSIRISVLFSSVIHIYVSSGPVNLVQ